MTLATLPSPNYTGADLAARVNAALLEARAARRFVTVAALLADASMTYGTGARAVAAGDVIEAGGHRYEVAAGTASDHQLDTAGGVKLKVLPGPDGTYSFAAMAPAADGVTDDYPKLRLLLDAVLTGTGIYRNGPAIFFPNGRYYMSQTIELKEIVRLMGNSSGQGFAPGAELVFPTDTSGLVVNQYNTLNGAIEDPYTTGADSSIIEGLRFTSTPGSDKSRHGIRLRGRALIRNCVIIGFSGDGIHIHAVAGGDAASAGNANCFRLDTLYIHKCENGVYVDSADANAGIGIHLDVAGNRRWGINDTSFLGNTWIACHTADNGFEGTVRSAFATYGGLHYHAVPGATEEQLRTTQPGTNANVWRSCPSTGANYSAPGTGTNAVGTYRQGGSYLSDDPNAKSTFVGCYAEGGQGLIWMSPRSVWIGGFSLETPIQGPRIEGANGVVSVNGVVSDNRDPASGVRMTAGLGGAPSNGQVLSWRHDNDASTYGFRRDVHGNYRFDADNSDFRVYLNLTTEDTIYSFGRGAAQPYKVHLPNPVIGQRHHASGTAAPTSGTFARGDIVWNEAPTAGGKAGWICTAGGAPGTWKPFGSIDA